MSVRKHRGEFEVAKGFGLPRYTTVQRNTYAPPQPGYMVWDTDEEETYLWDGTQWTNCECFKLPWKMQEKWIKPPGTTPVILDLRNIHVAGWSDVDQLTLVAPNRLSDFLTFGIPVTYQNVRGITGLNMSFSGTLGSSNLAASGFLRVSDNSFGDNNMDVDFNQDPGMNPFLKIGTNRPGTSDFVLKGGATWNIVSVDVDTHAAVITGNGTDTITLDNSANLNADVTQTILSVEIVGGPMLGWTMSSYNKQHHWHTPFMDEMQLNLPVGSPVCYTVQHFVDGTLIGVNDDEMNDQVTDLTGLYKDIAQVRQTINSTAHGLTLPLAGFIPLGVGAVLAQDDVVDTAFYAVTFPDANTIEIVSNGIIEVIGHGLTVGQYYYVDATTPGAITLIKPRPESFAIAIAPTVDTIVLSDTGFGGADIPPVTQLYNLLTDLPLPTTKAVGTEAKVVNDGANNGSYTAVGANVGANALAWVKG